MCFTRVFSVIVSGFDHVSVSGYVSEMSVHRRPGSYDLEYMTGFVFM